MPLTPEQILANAQQLYDFEELARNGVRFDPATASFIFDNFPGWSQDASTGVLSGPGGESINTKTSYKTPTNSSIRVPTVAPKTGAPPGLPNPFAMRKQRSGTDQLTDVGKSILPIVLAAAGGAGLGALGGTYTGASGAFGAPAVAGGAAAGGTAAAGVGGFPGVAGTGMGGTSGALPAGIGAGINPVAGGAASAAGSAGGLVASGGFWESIIPAITTIAGGIYSGRQAGKAADAQVDASKAAIAEQARQFDLIRGDTASARQLGESAIDRINRLYGYSGTSSGASPAGLTPGGASIIGRAGRPQAGGPGGLIGPGGGESGVSGGSGQPDMSAFFESPDYQFNLAEGQKAIDRSLAARGRALSGAGVKEGVRYASGMASNEYGNFYNRLASQAGIGQTGVNTSAQAGLQTAANTGNALTNQGDARASGYAGRNDAVQGTLGTLLDIYLRGYGGG